MGLVMGVTAVLLAIAAAIVGLLVWTALLFPLPVARARRALVAHSARCLISGIGLTLLLGVPIFVLLHLPHGLAKLAGWTLALPLVAILVVGFTAMAQLLGERMQDLSPAMTPLGALVRGAVTIELSAILPFVGWFLFTPLVGLALIGAGAHGCFSRLVRQDEPRRHRDHSGSDEVARGALDTREPQPLSTVILQTLILLCVLCVSAVTTP
jgi:hypothetical protein